MYKWNQIHLVPFVHSLSYILIRVHLVPNYPLAGDPLELSQGTLGVPGPQFESQWPSLLCPTLAGNAHQIAKLAAGEECG